MDATAKIINQLVALYGESEAKVAYLRLEAMLAKYQVLTDFPSQTGRGEISQKDVIVITYPDQVLEPGVAPLQSLTGFFDRYIKDIISGVHILPFFPYSSDDGFSVIDYRMVNPDFGSWEDIAVLGRSFRLMFDAVINHVSVQHQWFTEFLNGNRAYQDYFVVIDGKPNLSQVVRPRAIPLLSNYSISGEVKPVWTTFSPDQVDLNYANSAVLLEIIDILLFYSQKGGEFIRLDAVAYLWKEIGTSCINLPQTHQVIQLLRSILDLAAQRVLLITETNIPHLENISYFGDGENEAQLVYNFALPPLVLYTLQTGRANKLAEWAKTLILPSAKTTFFNFLASHDGIGLNPVRGILDEAEINELVERTIARGGLVSYKANSDGTQSPYELNINYFDALVDPQMQDSQKMTVGRFMAAQAIMLSLIGMPGIYFHSLFGSRGWMDGVELTGRSRSINREKLDRLDLENELENPDSLRYQVFMEYLKLLQARRSSQAFDPHSRQDILAAGESIFALARTSPDGSQQVLCLQNVTSHPCEFNPASVGIPIQNMKDLIHPDQEFHGVEDGMIRLNPYQTAWLEY